MVPLKGIEPPTLSLRMTCSTPELQRRAVCKETDRMPIAHSSHGTQGRRGKILERGTIAGR